jgi:hypothetical protein
MCSWTMFISANPILGRGFLPEEDSVPGRDAVAIISYNVWQKLGNDSSKSAENPHATCDVAGVGNGTTEIPNRARRWKRWILPRNFLRVTAPALDPTRAAFTQFSLGLSTLSITRTSTDAFDDSNLKPTSSTAVKIDGPEGSLAPG